MERDSGSSLSAHLPIQFKFPAKAEQLAQQPGDPNLFWVQDSINVGPLEEEAILETLEPAFSAFTNYNKSLRVLTNEVFDPVYSVMRSLGEVSLTIKKELFQHLLHGLKNLILMIEKTRILDWASENFLSESTIMQLIREEP